MLQRQVSVALYMDNAIYCKIEKGDRRTKREQISFIAKILQADSQKLLILLLANQVIEMLEKDKEISNKVLNNAKQKLKL